MNVFVTEIPEFSKDVNSQKQGNSQDKIILKKCNTRSTVWYIHSISLQVLPGREITYALLNGFCWVWMYEW